MGLLWFHNPDFYETAALGRNWSDVHANVRVTAGYPVTSGGLTATTLGAYATRFMREQQDNSRFAVGCRFKVTTLPASAQILLGVVEADGIIQTCVSLNPDGTLTVWRGPMDTELQTTSALVTPNVWYRFGFKGIVSRANGEAEVHLNSTPDAENIVAHISGGDTAFSDHIGWHGIYVGVASEMVSGHYYAVDGYGPTSGLIHGLLVTTLFPDAAGDYDEWDKSGGTLPEVLDDMNPDDDSTHISTDTIGSRYATELAALATTSVIHGVQQNVHVKNTPDSGLTPSHELLCRIGQNDVYDDWQSVDSAFWKTLWSCWPRHPVTGQPWTVSNINSDAQWGGRVRG